MKFRDSEWAALSRTLGLLSLADAGIASRSMAGTITVTPPGLAPGSRLFLTTVFAAHRIRPQFTDRRNFTNEA